MRKLKEIRQLLLTVLVCVLCLRVILWAITPFIPLIIECVIVVSVLGVVYGLLFFRTTKL